MLASAMSALSILGGMSLAAGTRALALNVDNAARALSERPSVAREIDRFTRAIEDAEKSSDLLDDYRLNRFVLHAYGLEGYAQARAVIKRAMDQGIIDSPEEAERSVAGLALKRLAGDFAPMRNSQSVRDRQIVGEEVVGRYLRRNIEALAKAVSPPLARAMKFQRMIDDGAEWELIASDPDSYDMLRNVLGLPEVDVAKSIDERSQDLKEGFGEGFLNDVASVEGLVDAYLKGEDYKLRQAADPGEQKKEFSPASPRPVAITTLSADTIQSVIGASEDADFKNPGTGSSTSTD